MPKEFTEIKRAILALNADETRELIIKSLAAKCPPEEILKNGLIAGMKEVGELFNRKEYFVPEVLIAAEAFYAGFEIIRPLLKTKTQETKSKVVIGVVAGDIHDIGKNIVKVMLEVSGHQVIDLGRDVPTETFINAVIEEKPQILALSSLMTTTMGKMGDVIRALKERNLSPPLKVIVGGAPVNEDFARMIGADGYGEDAAQAVKLVEKLTGYH